MDRPIARLWLACRKFLARFVIPAVSLFVCGGDGAAATAFQPDMNDNERKAKQDPRGPLDAHAPRDTQPAAGRRAR